MLEANPNLRVVGAHLGSMEADFHQLAQHLDKYPNFAVDLAARMPYVEMQPRAEMIAFITKYQDRLIYATDNELPPDSNAQKPMKDWEEPLRERLAVLCHQGRGRIPWSRYPGTCASAADSSQALSRQCGQVVSWNSRAKPVILCPVSFRPKSPLPVGRVDSSDAAQGYIFTGFTLGKTH